MPKDFLGVPLVIEEMPAQEGDTPDVARIVPLSYAVMKTDAGTMKCVFYYESAPHTVDTFLTLSEQGFYDGLTFHRVVPDFVIQGGDPTGTGSGGPGFHIGAEFNNRPHIAGVLSMARNGDPNEDPQNGVMPRRSMPTARGASSSSAWIIAIRSNSIGVTRPLGRWWMGWMPPKRSGNRLSQTAIRERRRF